MKKILLVGMLVISGLSFGRDFEYREKQEFKTVEEVSRDSEMISRYRYLGEQNQEKYEQFHKELDNMSRGHDNR